MSLSRRQRRFFPLDCAFLKAQRNALNDDNPYAPVLELSAIPVSRPYKSKGASGNLEESLSMDKLLLFGAFTTLKKEWVLDISDPENPDAPAIRYKILDFGLPYDNKTPLTVEKQI